MVSGIPAWQGRPTLTVGGSAQADLTQSMRSLLVQESLEGLYRCEITLSNWGSTKSGEDYLDFSGGALDFGATVSVSVPGSDGSPAAIFVGRITGLEGLFPAGDDPQLTVLAEDALQDLRMTRRTRTWADASLSSVVQEVVTAHGLSASVSATAPESYKVLAQVNQTDLAFLRELGRNVDAEVWIADGTLSMKSHIDRPSGSSVQQTYGKELWEFSVLADLAGQRSGLTLTGWDVTAKQAITASASDSDLGSELEGTSGSSTLASKLASHTEEIVHMLPGNADEACFLAKAAYRRLARRFLTGRGTCAGDPRVRVGTYLSLQGLGLLFSGRYYVVGCRHLFDEVQGYRTEFEVERPGIGG